MKKLLSIVAISLTAVSLSACGASSSTSGTAHNTQAIAGAKQNQVTQQSIQKMFLAISTAKLNDMGTIQYLAPGEDSADMKINAACSVNVILTDQQEVSTYQGSSDIVLNPAGTVGVKITGTDESQAGCMTVATNVLKHVR